MFVVIVVSLALAVIAAAPVKGPIALTSCRIVTANVNTAIAAQQAFRVTYKNTSQVTATTVYFQAVLNGKTLTVVDKGRFAPGATISHQLMTNDFIAVTQSQQPASCQVAAVQFVNGTSWVSPTARL